MQPIKAHKLSTFYFIINQLTMSSMAKPLVHLIRMPDNTDICFTGNENVNPSSILLTADSSENPSSFSTNSFRDEAIKSKRSCQKKKLKKWQLQLLIPSKDQKSKKMCLGIRTNGLQTQSPHLCLSLDVEE